MPQEGYKDHKHFENKHKKICNCSSICWFLSQSCKDVKRHKCQTCLGFFSVFFVVLTTLIINTVIDKGPIIFLRLAEGNVGEIDAFIESSLNSDISGSVELVNLTQINSLYGEEYNLSPRLSKIISFFVPENKDAFILSPQTGLPIFNSFYSNLLNFEDSGNMKVINIDTDQERKINCGKDYKYEKLGLGECLIPEDFANSYSIKKEDFVFLKWKTEKEMTILWDHFKVRTGVIPVKDPYFNDGVTAPCKVVGIFGSSGGKLANADDSKTIFMEVEHYYTWISDYINLESTDISMVQFREFLKGEFARPYDFADYVIMNFPNPRVDYYSSSNYDDVQDKVIGYTNVLVNKLGFFPESVN